MKLRARDVEFSIRGYGVKGKIYGRICTVLFSIWIFFVSGCAVKESQYLNDYLEGINHTSEPINHYAVNGFGGGRIQSHGFSRSSCCMLLPRKWRPGLDVLVEWETDPNPRARLPALGTVTYAAAYAAHEKKYRQFAAVVEVPYYEAPAVCSLKIHFLPCNQLKATTACPAYRQPSYPIKEPLVMKEPAKCKI